MKVSWRLHPFSASRQSGLGCHRIFCNACSFRARAGPSGERLPAVSLTNYESAASPLLVQSDCQWFSGEKIALGYRIDLVVESLVIVEMKSVEAVHPVHQAQLLSYMRLSGIGVGLWINFYVLHLRDGIKRLVVG